MRYQNRQYYLMRDSKRESSQSGIQQFHDRQSAISECGATGRNNPGYCTQNGAPHMPGVGSQTWAPSTKRSKPQTPVQANGGFDERVCMQGAVAQCMGDQHCLMLAQYGCQGAYADPGTTQSGYGPQQLPKDYMHYQYPTGTTWPWYPSWSRGMPTARM